MEAQKAKERKTVLNYGLLLGILMVILVVIMYVMDLHLDPHWSFILITLAIFIAVIVYGIKAFKNDNGGFLSFGEALKVSVGIGLIAAIISGIWSLVLTTVIEPDYADQMAEVQREKMIESYPEMSEEQINQALEFSAGFSSPWITFASTLVMYMLLALVIGLIAGAVMKQNRPYEV